MGLNVTTARFLCSLRAKGLSFVKTLTLGRQHNRLTEEKLNSIRSEYDIDNVAPQTGDSAPEFADSFFYSMGAENVDVMDVSDYEGANIIHDMNREIPPDLKNRYSLVLDGGTLEHVFEYPTALRNAMNMVQLGGHLVLATPCNNMMGHGFYCFSPELFWRAFTPENGFRVSRMVIADYHENSQWHEVSDPKAIRQRVLLTSAGQMSLLYVAAQKIENLEPFRVPPQQSDYALVWNKEATLQEVVPQDGNTGGDYIQQKPRPGKSPLFDRLRSLLRRQKFQPNVSTAEKTATRNLQKYSYSSQPEAYKRVDR